jgi:hypothetical protein
LLILKKGYKTINNWILSSNTMNVEIVSRKALSGFKQEKHVFHFLGARISIRVSSIGNPKNSGGIVALVGSQWGATFEWW